MLRLKFSTKLLKRFIKLTMKKVYWKEKITVKTSVLMTELIKDMKWIGVCSLGPLANKLNVAFATNTIRRRIEEATTRFRSRLWLIFLSHSAMVYLKGCQIL